MNTKQVRRQSACYGFYWCCLWATILASTLQGAACSDTDVTPSPPDEIAQSHGYRSEQHAVTTSDGYILETFRLPGNAGEENGSRPAVLLVPGILCNAAAWFLNNNNSLPYLLVDAGYDVWIAAGRGTRYSRSHVSLSTSSREFWNYSFHEHGVYDVPALVDYVIGHTGRPTLQYIGYSMGGAMFLVTTSLLDAYRDRVSHAYLLAPAAFVWSSTNTLFRSSPVVGTIANLLTHGEVTFDSPVVHKVLQTVCATATGDAFCAGVLGTRTSNQTEEQVKFNYQYFPDSTSAKTLLHYGQSIYRGAWFRQFDYGVISNIAKYSSVSPPDYPLDKATVPTSVFYGADDVVVGVESSLQLIASLPNVKRSVRVDGLTHVDVLWGENVRTTLYEPLVQSMQEDSA